MDNIKIKDYIINNFKDDNSNTIKNAIEESIKEDDEVTLPGMGVFFEILWKSSDEELKNKILTILESKICKKDTK